MHGGEAIDEAGHSSFARQIPSGLAPLNPSIQSLQLPMTSKHDDNLSQSESPVSILATQQLASAQRHGAYPSSLPPHADKSQARAAVDDEILSMRARHWATVLCQTDARMNVPAHRSTAVKSKESVEVSSTLAQTTTSSIVTHETRAAALSGRASSLLENFIRDNGVDRLETPDSFFGADSSTTTRQLSADSSVADKPAPAQKPKRFQCQLCGSTFAQRGDMIRHIRVKELGERKFTCPVCSKAFGRRSILNKHLDRVHGTKRPKQARSSGPGNSDAARTLISLSHSR